MKGGQGPGRPSSRRKRATAKLLLAFVALCVFGVSAFQVVAGQSISANWTAYVTVAAIVIIAAHALCSALYLGSIYNFGLAFITVVGLFHLGHVLADAVGWITVEFFHRGELALWCQRAGWYICVAMACFSLGTAISWRRTMVKVDRNGDAEKVARRVFVAGLGLLLACLVAFVLLVLSVGNIFLYSRQQIYSGIGDTRGLGFVLSVLPTALILLGAGAVRTRQRVLIGGVALLGAFVVLFLGERSYVFFPAIVAAVIWVKCGGRMPTAVVIPIIVIGVLSVPVISALRATGPYSEIGRRDISESIEKSSVKGAVMEIGGVVSLVANVLRWVPADESYRYGMSYIRALVEAVPNIGRTSARSMRENAEKMQGGGAIDVSSLRPADWYTYKINRWMFEHGGGSGFSVVAEAYMNFGPAGVALVFIVIGGLLAYLDARDIRTSYVAMLCAAMFVWPLLKLVRNDMVSFVKPASLGMWALLIWVIVLTLLPSARRGRQGESKLETV